MTTILFASGICCGSPFSHPELITRLGVFYSLFVVFSLTASQASIFLE